MFLKDKRKLDVWEHKYKIIRTYLGHVCTAH
jgi:hypothetical protein